jgi:hypothetical protein
MVIVEEISLVDQRTEVSEFVDGIKIIKDGFHNILWKKSFEGESTMSSVISILKNVPAKFFEMLCSMFP